MSRIEIIAQTSGATYRLGYADGDTRPELARELSNLFRALANVGDTDGSFLDMVLRFDGESGSEETAC